MNYFSISTLDDEHVGFLVMMVTPDNPDRGEFALKLNASGSIKHDFTAIEQDNRALFWQKNGEKVQLFDSDQHFLGNIQQEWLTIAGERFVLTDLTGSI